MKAQFEIWEYNFPIKGPHPVVLISPPDRCAHAKHVNVLFCTSQRQSRRPYPTEVMLDVEDGLSWETFCDCSIMYAVDSEALMRKRGKVTVERRNVIRDRIRDLFRLPARD
jgi:mRNA-degrading endonuclease toxin of MazEF toxin-antitoxin module